MLGADRDLRRHHVRPEGALQGVQRAEEVGPLAVEHVHVDQPGHAQLRGALPQPLRADLDAHDRVDDEHGRLAHAQRAEGVGDEGRLARGVDQVDLDAVPVEGGQRRGDRHPTRLLVVVGVRDRRTVSHRAETGRRAGLEQQGLVQRRLPAPPVAHQRHVADPVCRMGHARHLALLCLPLPQGGDGAVEATGGCRPGGGSSAAARPSCAAGRCATRSRRGPRRSRAGSGSRSSRARSRASRARAAPRSRRPGGP